jgi:Tol biopolymer transport system component
MQARVLVLAVSVALALLVGACQGAGGSSGSTAAQGRIAWPKDGDLWVYDLDSKQQKKITNLPGGAAVTGASWSADGKRVVYSQFWRRPNERASGADLFVANADGSNAQIFAERDAANSVLEAPQWADSGTVYYSMRHVQNGRESLQVVRQKEGGQPEVLVENAFNPTVSPDESILVYLRYTRAGQSMMKKTLGQPGDGCELMNDQVFQYLSPPRISPDGTRVALGGSGEPNSQPSGCGSAGGQPKPSGAPSLLDLGKLLAPGVAHAETLGRHGLPADIYTLTMDGGNLTRIADIKDDDPTVAWSPDGAKMAIFGIGALYLVDSKGGPTTKLVEQGGYGGLDWTR